MKVCTSQWRSIGYYESWNVGRPAGCPKIEPDEIDASKWTHIHYGFAIVTDSGELEMGNDAERAQLFKLQNLKSRYPNLQLVISVGGWAFNNQPTSHRFTSLAASPEKRQRFVQSVERFLNRYRLDGLDIDWEYPAAPDRGGNPGDIKNYVLLLKELRAALGRFSLSIAAPASYWYLKGFDIAEMAKYLDYIVYMTYDLHGNWDWANKWVGPTLNPHNNWTEVEGALTMIQRAGVPSNKIILGIGFYGRSFKLTDPSCNTPGICTFQDPGPLNSDIDNYSNLATPGRCTQSGGTLASFEIQEIIRDQKLTPVFDRTAISKLLTYNNGKEWIGYDDDETVAIKATKAREQCLGGLVVWALDLDDDLLTSTLEDGGFLQDGDLKDNFLPWNQAIQQFSDGFDFNLDNGHIADDFYTKVSTISSSMYSQYTFSELGLYRLFMVGMNSAQKRLKSFITDRLQIQAQEGSAKVKSDEILQFQTSDPIGRSFFACEEDGKTITCPTPPGRWKNGVMVVRGPGADVQWKVIDENGDSR